MRILDIHHRSVEAVNGQPNLLELGCAREGYISEISLIQVGGTPNVAFSYEIFTCRAAAVTGAVSMSDDPSTPEDEGLATPSMYKLNATSVTGLAGAAGKFSPTTPVRFRNADDGGGMTRAKGKIYVVLTPSGSGPSAWDVRIQGETLPSN